MHIYIYICLSLSIYIYIYIHWKMPLKIHDAFRGVDFWSAIFCPYRGNHLSKTTCLAHALFKRDE